MLRVARVVVGTRAEGPGLRAAVWVQGCSLRCPGCCNPEMFAPDRGDAVDPAALVASWPAEIEGVSVLGGEPFEQPAALSALLAAARGRGLGTMVFSGYTLDELRAAGRDLGQVDILVDGRYDRTQPDEVRRWVGSRNQQMHFLTERYAADDPVFTGARTVELHLRDGELVVVGWPSAAARVVPR
jgi:anaerobic ribonucleoside-triphosphate reductase activating protein